MLSDLFFKGKSPLGCVLRSLKNYLLQCLFLAKLQFLEPASLLQVSLNNKGLFYQKLQ